MTATRTWAVRGPRIRGATEASFDAGDSNPYTRDQSGPDVEPVWGRIAAGTSRDVIAIATLLVLMTIGLLITRIATVVLEATGMSTHAARFQARSAFTGSGFTTRESESVVDHPVRRKVIMWLMLLGNAGIVAAAGSLIIGFRGRGSDAWRVLELGAGLIVLLVVSRSRYVDRLLTLGIGRALERFSGFVSRDTDSLIRLADGYTVSELSVEDGDWIAGRTLRETGLRDEGIVVLGIERANGRYVAAPSADSEIRPRDTLIVYGAARSVHELDDRRAGTAGDRRHVSATEHHRRRASAERARPEASLSR